MKVLTLAQSTGVWEPALPFAELTRAAEQRGSLGFPSYNLDLSPARTLLLSHRGRVEVPSPGQESRIVRGWLVSPWGKLRGMDGDKLYPPPVPTPNLPSSC